MTAVPYSSVGGCRFRIAACTMHTSGKHLSSSTIPAMPFVQQQANFQELFHDTSPVGMLRAQHKVQLWHAPQQLRPFLLGHTASDHQLQVSHVLALPLSLQCRGRLSPVLPTHQVRVDCRGRTR